MHGLDSKVEERCWGRENWGKGPAEEKNHDEQADSTYLQALGQVEAKPSLDQENFQGEKDIN